MKRVAVVGSFIVLSFGVGACGPDYDHTDITGVKASGLAGSFDKAKLDVHEGLIVKAHIVGWNDDREAVPLEVRAVDPTVVEVAGIISDRDYAFVGLRSGHTQIELRFEGEVVLIVEADVHPQPELPPP